jgi:hypothetical protein
MMYASDRPGGSWDGLPEEFGDFDDWDAAQRRLLAAGLTDGLPVVPPSRGRIRRMLARNGVDADQVLAEFPIQFAPVTWRNVAIQAVMAGCADDCLPVVGAAVRAMADPAFNIVSIAATTGSAAPLILVSGPIAARIGMNGSYNALGPGNRANATIGRAVSLFLRNVLGAMPGELDMATLGQPAKYTCCLAENEEGSPWTHLRQERGYGADESVVTVFGIAGTMEVVEGMSLSGEDLANTFAQSMLIAGLCGSSGFIGGGEPLLLIPSEIAQRFADAGYDKARAQAEIYERAQLPRERLSPRVRGDLARLGESTAPMRVAARAADVTIVVAGGVGIKAAYVPTWGGGTRSVTRRIEP